MQEVQIAEETGGGRVVRRRSHGPHLFQRHRRLRHPEVIFHLTLNPHSRAPSKKMLLIHY